MRLIATLDIPEKDEEYISNLVSEGDDTALREYVDNAGWFDVSVELS